MRCTRPPLKLWPLAGLIALALSGQAAAQTFSEGVAALDRSDIAGALRIFQNTASRGDAPSQFALAEMYRQGQGTPANPAMALAWYRKAADQDNPGAEFALGRLYQAGRGVAKNDGAAAGWYEKAAAHDYAGAAAALGLLQRDVGASGPPAARFHAMMDRVFGPGRWRETSGYRSVAQEDALRRQGAGVVPLGQRSHHSMGDPNAPGAYDIVVDGMTPQLAAAKLKHAPVQLARVVAEAAHGGQGPHLHIEPVMKPIPAAAPYRRIAVSMTAQAGQN
ncbi:MAG TPA: tetratricopeptide repeat protein [Caulobacteraceae bacterium]|jgi:hypothetical protein|nr:tetratricopeptide repeat protein [Caulobacteraceae bacterium]